MKRLICFLKGHVPYWEPAEQPEPGVFIGGVRYCGRCYVTLEGMTPQVGDRKKL